MRLSLCIAFLLSFTCSGAQTTYKLEGSIIPQDYSIMAISVFFECSDNGELDGTTRTMLNNNEFVTSSIKGRIKNDRISFEEIQNINSDIDTSSVYCYIKVDKAKMRTRDKEVFLWARFTNKDENRELCPEGFLMLSGVIEESSSPYQKADKILEPSIPLASTKPARTILPHQEEMFNGDVERLQWATNEATLYINDFIESDGDSVMIILNEEIIFNDCISAEQSRIVLSLNSGDNRVKIIALNEGKTPSNTASIVLKGEQEVFWTKYRLRKEESIELHIQK